MIELNKYIILQGSTLKDAVAKIRLNKVRTIIVVNENKVVGVISEGDILKAFMKFGNLPQIQIYTLELQIQKLICKILL